MAGYNHFDYVPSTVDRKRSVFKYDKACARSAYIGWLYPMCKPERMMPGSTLSLDLAMEVRSGALIAPLMDELILDAFSFFVPNRIIWEHWKQFVGAVDDVLFNNLTQYQIPSFKFGMNNGSATTSHTPNKPVTGSELFTWNQTIACHFGLMYPAASHTHGKSNAPLISALPFRGYTLIWNMNFRPEQLVAPQVISKGDLGAAGQNIEADLTGTMTFGSLTIGCATPSENSEIIAMPDSVVLGGAILPTYRVHRSLWTSCLPAPSLETLNLLAGLDAPVGIIPSFDVALSSGSVNLGFVNNQSFNKGTFKQAGVIKNADGTASSSDLQNVVADLNQVLLTVNNYRETIMLQNYYDVLNRAGSRYDEIIANIFGVRTSNAVIDIPELITHKRFTIYRKQVIAQASSDFNGGNNTQPLGSQGAYIDTVVKDSFFTKSTTEHGYIHMLYTIRPARIRTNQGIEPEWEELNKMDLYYPQFDGMGDVPRYTREVKYDYAYTDANQKGILGYQEYGAVWKWQRSDAAGFLDNNIAGSVRGMVINDSFSTFPTLITAVPQLLGFVSCYSECVAFSNCLAIVDPRLAPQFILDIRLTGSIAHPMPVYNIPGKGALL